MFNYIRNKFDQFRSKKLVIFGTSQEGRLTSAIMKSVYNITPTLFIDNDANKYGNKQHDVDIVPPEIIKTMSNYIVVVPTMYYKEMYEQLLELGVSKKDIVNFDIYENDFIFPKYDMSLKLIFYLFLNKN